MAGRDQNYFIWQQCLETGFPQRYAFVLHVDQLLPGQLPTILFFSFSQKQEFHSYSIITMESNETMSWIHHRMPAILDTEEKISVRVYF